MTATLAEKPVQTIPIEWKLANGVTLIAAKIQPSAVVVEWVNESRVDGGGAIALPPNVERVVPGRTEARETSRRRRLRYRTQGLVFDAPVLKLRGERGWRFRAGQLSAGGTPDQLRGATRFRVSRRRLGTSFTLSCAGERVTVRVPGA